MTKTRADLAANTLRELQVLREGETPASGDSAVVVDKINEVMLVVERRGTVTDWRGDAIDEIYMDALAKLMAARVCTPFVTPREIPIYMSLEPAAWKMLSEINSEPYQARPIVASHI